MRSLLSLLVLIGMARSGWGDDLRCLTDAERAQAVLYARLQAEAYQQLDQRLQRFETLQGTDAIRAYQASMRSLFIERLGGFPQRTPLNPRTIRTIERSGYRIECVIFESQPNHHVTANLYLPDATEPTPGIIVSSGHSRTAKAADYNQRFGIMMAQHGMAALCFDPIGQGERSQLLNAEGEPPFRSTTTEHSLLGVGSILVGRNTARYRVWDAIRAIDYLQHRPEVDAERIGMTGCSGGGTLTSYVMAIDERVRCAAPACYLTTWRRLIETIGPQDAEQNIFGQIAAGLDHPDYVLLRAPRPTLISSTTADFFDINGSWSTFRQAKRIYSQLGIPEAIDLVETEGSHGVRPQNLATITHWFARWLQHDDRRIAAQEPSVLSVPELQCTTAGQVLTLPDQRTVYDFNAAEAKRLAGLRRDTSSEADLRTSIRQLIKVPEQTSWQAPKFRDVGRVHRDSYHIDKLVMESPSGSPIPALTFHPPSPDEAAYLYLHEEGKQGDTEPSGAVEQLVAEGYAVITADLSGQGETGSARSDALLGDWKTFFLAYLLGDSLVGRRTQDAIAAAEFVAFYEKEQDDPRDVHLVGVGQGGIVALHAAALRPELFSSITLRATPRSWEEIVAQRIPKRQLEGCVHGALKVYDLPDLVRLAGKAKVTYE